MKEFSSPINGMITDVDILNQAEDSYTFALNAMLENSTGDGLVVQNDYSNILGAVLIEGENVIAKEYIPALDIIILFTTKNRILSLSSKLYNDSNMNQYNYSSGSVPLTPDNNVPVLDIKILAESSCFNWSIDNKVDVQHKITDSTLNIYFVDGGRNEDKFIYFDLPSLELNDSFKKIISLDNYDNPIYINEIDCNKLKWYPDVPYPKVVTRATEGGNLIAGVYQVLVGFATSKGVGLTPYRSATNPFPLFTKTTTDVTNYNTGKAIEIKISNIDVTGRYRYVNIAIATTVNEITTYSIVATLPVDNVITYTYTGDAKAIPIDEIGLFNIYPFYRSSKGLTKAGNKLFKFKVKEFDKFNLQPVVNTIKLKWFTITASEGDYKKPEFAQNYRTYTRDEVYAFGIKFILDNTEETQVFPLVNRKIELYDQVSVVNSKDTLKPEDDECNKNPFKFRKQWEVYNTAFVTKTKNSEHKCDYTQYQEGEFAYWQSTETYPNDPNVWGTLANTPIRLFKTPDCLVSPIHNGGVDGQLNYADDNFIFPLGVKLDDKEDINNTLQEAVNQGLITEEQKNRIRGYKIVRGNRVGNESVIAKGWLSDVWAYNDKGTTAYYPNHGFNDLRVDPYLSSQDLKTFAPSDIRKTYRSEFHNETKKYNIYSPDTSFREPALGTILKLESIIHGTSQGFFSPSRGQGEYVILNQLHYNFAIIIAYLLTARLKLSEAQPGQQGQAIGSGIGGIIGGVVGAAIGGVGAPLGAVVGSGLGGIIGRLVGGNTANDDYNAMYQLSMWISQTDRILELLSNTIPLQNYHYQFQAVGKYNNTLPVLNSGNKQRRIINSSYVKSGRQLLPGGVRFNNNYRESSVYLEIEEILPPTSIQDVSKVTHKPNGECYDDNEPVISTVASYYASIKREVVNQYGGINSIEWLPVSNTLWKLDEKFSEFGGDQFINRFAFKRSHSFFTQTAYKLPDRLDIYYEDYPNIAYPLYFFNTKYTELSEAANVNLKILAGIENSFPLILALNNIESPQAVTDNPVAWDSNEGLQKAIGALFKKSVMNPYVTTRPGRFYLDCTSDNFVEYLQDTIQTPASSTWWKNTFGEGDVDKFIPNMRFNFEGVKGRIYTYNHAIPYFLCESNINLDLRYAIDNNENDFYPNQTNLDYWLQEENVNPRIDNKYSYNRSYSKQNKEEITLKTDANFFKEKDKNFYENRVVYSQEGAEVENSSFKDNYLYFKPLDVKDFSFENGKLTSVDALESNNLLIRFENSTGIVPSTQTLLTQEGESIVLGSGNIFNNYQEFAKTDLGYIGSQHTDILHTEFGHIIVDSKRGNIFNIAAGGKDIDELSKDGMKNWFIENLPFKISKYFKNIDVDNSYNNIGLSLSYDKRYKRFFITKLDFVPLYKEIKYINNKFYYNNTEISLRDKNYFCNASWTISYSFYKKTWTSFHTFTPNYYIDGINLFYTGLNGLSQGLSSLWVHNLSNKTYQKYYNITQPFIVEVVNKTSLQSNILTNISFMLSTIRYHNEYDRSSVDNVSFNKAIVFNEKQNSGLLKLNLVDENKLSSVVKYPIRNVDSVDISLKKNEDIFSFNQFSDLSFKNNLPRFINTCNNVNKTLNLKAINYDNLRIDNNYIRSQKTYIRLINDVNTEYKFIFRGLITEVVPSII